MMTSYFLTLQRNTRRNELNFPVLDRKTGAILSTTRFTAHPVDKLSLEYDGNRLVAVTDEVEEEAVYNRKEYHDLNTDGNDFGYDANGNLIYDLDRDIVTIRYNLLNLPDTVQFRDGRQILNKYAADGTRLASTYYTPTSITVNPLSVGEVINLSTYPPYLLDRVRTWFVDNKEYGLMYPEHYDYLELKRIHTPEGYVDQYDNYHYYRRDHLGNVREVWKATDSVALTVQRTRYYPSGLPWEYQAGDSASLQPYKFNSCEFIETHGYDVTDLGNRGVYHAINRFTSMDRFAEKYPWQSPYVHAGNNPVNFVDVAGDSIWTTIDDVHYYYGQDANGNYGFIGADGSMYSGNNLFVNNLTEALEKLMLGGKTGNDLVVALMKSVNSVRIDYGTPNTTDIGENNITWSPNSKTGGMNSLGVESRPAFIGLGHEMAHILDAWNGTIDNSVWVTAGKQVISNAEKYATHIENLLRSENGIPLRTHYAIDISTGVRIGLESTRIIQGRTSLFYQQQNGVSANGIPLLQTAFFYNL